MIVETWLWVLLFAVALPACAVGGGLLVRRLVGVDVLASHNDVAGFIYAVIGVVYAVLLGFSAIIVWEQFRRAQEGVASEANALADLYRDSRVFPLDVRNAIELNVREYVRLVVQKEWPAMAEGKSSAETWGEYNRLWRTYQEFVPENEHQRIWYAQSLELLNTLADARRDRLVSTRSAVPAVMWGVLLVGGAITICFSFFFGNRNARAQALMTAGIALTIGVALLSILALEKPFAGITRVDTQAFNQVDRILAQLRQPASPR
jgi:hypothetical protein